MTNTAPGPRVLRVTKADEGYVVQFDIRPQGRKTPVRITKVAADEFDLRGILNEVYK